MKIFVTGGNGFIGSHLVAKLIERGDTVSCLVRDPKRADHLQQMGAQLVAGDITNRTILQEPIRGTDAVFHLAGLYKFGLKYVPQMRSINVEGTCNVLETAAELGVPHILHTSTVGVFGNTHGIVVDEAYRCKEEDLESLYEQTKWEAHYKVAVPLQQKGAPLIILQPGGVTGAGDPSPHVTQVDYYLRRVPIGFGTKAGFTWAHVDDIAEGHILALERGKNGEAYVLAGPPITWKQIMESWERLTGIPAPKIWAPNWMMRLTERSAELMERMGIDLEVTGEGVAALIDSTFWATADKAKRELGWHSRPPDDTSRDILEYEMKRLGMTK